jgi:hypothetical protein
VEYKALRDHKVNWGTLETTDYQEQREIQDGRVHQEYHTQDLKESQVRLVHKGRGEILDGQGPKELQEWVAKV